MGYYKLVCRKARKTCRGMQNSSGIEQPAEAPEGSAWKGAHASTQLLEAPPVKHWEVGAHPRAKWRGQASFHALHKLLEGRLRF